MVFSSLPSEVQEKKDDEIEKNTEDDFEASEVPIEEIGSDLEEDNASGNDEGENTEEKKTEDQVDSVFDDSQGNESYVPIEDRPKEFSQEEQVDEGKMSDVEKIVMNFPPDSCWEEPWLVEDSPAKAPGDESEMMVEDWARVSEMVACHESIEDKISEITAKLHNAKKLHASRKFD